MLSSPVGAPEAAQTLSDGFDPVSDEAERWARFQDVASFCGTDGLINEFEMAWAVRERFPLRLIIFKQTACHLAHEANVEQVFSRAGFLTDPNSTQHRRRVPRDARAHQREQEGVQAVALRHPSRTSTTSCSAARVAREATERRRRARQARHRRRRLPAGGVRRRGRGAGAGRRTHYTRYS